MCWAPLFFFSLPTNCEWCLHLSCGRACVTTSSLEVELCACLASNCIYGFFASLLSLFLLSLHLVAVPFLVFQSFACSLFSTCSFHIFRFCGSVQMQRSPLLSCLLSFNFWLFSISFRVLNLGIILIHLLLILRTLNHTAHTIHICHDISSCFNLFASCTRAPVRVCMCISLHMYFKLIPLRLHAHHHHVLSTAKS